MIDSVSSIKGITCTFYLMLTQSYIQHEMILNQRNAAHNNQTWRQGLRLNTHA